MPQRPLDDGDEAPFPDDLAQALTMRGYTAIDEGALRRALERRVPGYNLYRLTRAAARRWKCRYRILFDAGYCDAQSAAEAYGRALLAALQAEAAAEQSATPPPDA
jgi:hypothetical protein